MNYFIVEPIITGLFLGIGSVVQSVRVTLTENGYQPGSFKLCKGVPARVTFVRKTDDTCGDEILLPHYKIKRELAFNRPVVVEFTPQRCGEFSFFCGRNVLQGKVIVG